MSAAENSASASSPGGDGDSGNLKRKLSETLLNESREELGRADGKASILFSASGVVVGVLIAGFIAGEWKPTQLGWFQLVWWPGAAFGLAAIVAFAMSVWPRVVHDRPREDLAYFGHVAQYGNLEELDAALLDKVSSSTGADRSVDQLFIVSAIADAKYRWIRRGVALLGVALFLCALSVAANQVFYVALR